ncbi:MAG: HlyD family efflux transporter periplasmic adaptor subunit [Cyanobacteria bacterium J06642_11]
MAEIRSPDRSGEAWPTAVDSSLKSSRFTYRGLIIWAVGFAALAAATVGFYMRYRGSQPEPIAVPLHTVERSDVELMVAASGSLALGGQQTLKSPQSEATVEQVLVQVRSLVDAGQPLVVLRDRDKERELRSQQVDIQKAELDLARRQEKVTEVEQRVAAAIEQYQESQELWTQGFIPEDDVRRDQAALDQVRSELKDAQLDVTKTELDLKTSQEILVALEQQLSDRVVVSPIAGLVLEVGVVAGEAIATDTALLTLGDPRQEIVNLSLTTLDAAKVSINQMARIRAIGPEAQDYDGRVVALAPQALAAGEGGRGASQEGQARVHAKIQLERPSQTLIPGSFVNVEIITEQRQNVAVVPPEAVQREAGESFVWIRNQRGKAEQQTIELGLQGLDVFEVTSGLEVGDQIALVPPTLTITPGRVLSDPSELPASENSSASREP